MSQLFVFQYSILSSKSIVYSFPTSKKSIVHNQITNQHCSLKTDLSFVLMAMANYELIIWHTETYLEVFCPLQSGFGLGPRACWPSFLKLISRTPRAAEIASDAIDDTENSDRSVVTDSCDGERSIRHATVSTGVCGGCCVVVDERLLVSTLDEAITFGRCCCWFVNNGCLCCHTHTHHIVTVRLHWTQSHAPIPDEMASSATRIDTRKRRVRRTFTPRRL